MKSRKGFTLIEIMIVMVVISIITGFIVANFRTMQRENIVTRARGDLKVIDIGVRYLFAINKRYPEPASYQLEILKLDNPKIINSLLFDPFSNLANIPYIYKLSPNKNYYLIYSVGILGNNEAEISDDGKVIFQKGDPASTAWISNGRL